MQNAASILILQSPAVVKSETEAPNLPNERRWHGASAVGLPDEGWHSQETVSRMQAESRHPSPAPRLAELSATSTSTEVELEGR